MLDLFLAAAHHVLMFLLSGLLACEAALIWSDMGLKNMQRLAKVDVAVGVSAVLLVIVGVFRVTVAPKGIAFYLANPIFWAKMAAFGVVALISIFPTIKFISWAREIRSDSSYLPPTVDLLIVRRCLVVELAIFIVIPILAAAMARGFGL